MPLELPNTINNEQAADGLKLKENFDAITAWINTEVLQRDGSVEATQPVTLPGDPTADDHAANKGYVDAEVATAKAVSLPLAGGTMTGQAKGIAPVDEEDFANKGYVDDQDGLLVPRTGGTMTGPISYGTDPTTSNHLARKSYVDSKYPKTGGAITGNVAASGYVSAEYLQVNDGSDGIRHDEVLYSRLEDSTYVGVFRPVTPHFDAATTDRTLTTTAQTTGATITIDPERAGFALITATFDFTMSSGNGIGYVQVSIDGGSYTSLSQQAIFRADGGGRGVVSQNYYHSLAAGSTYIFRTVVERGSTGSGSFESAHSNIIVMKHT